MAPPGGLEAALLRWPAVALALTVAPFVLTAWWMARRGTQRSRVDRLLTSALLTMVLAELAVIGLGSFGLFRLSALIAAEVILAVVVWATNGRRRVATPAPPDGTPATRSRGDRWAEAAMALGLTLLIAAPLAQTLLAPPTQWDSLGYHLPFPAHWVASGTADVPAKPATCSAYPLNHELWLAWLMLPLRSDLVAKFSSLPEWGVLFLALWGIAQQLRLKRAAAVGVACVGALSLLAEAVTSTGNDVAMAATFALAVYFIISLRLSTTLGRGLLAALATGLFIGVKYPCVVFQVALWPLAVAACWGRAAAAPATTEAERVQRLLRRVGVAVLLLAAVAVAGGFTYARNAAVTGNPFWPTKVRVGPVVLLEGPVTPETDKTPHERQFPHTYDLRNILLSPVYRSALGPQFYFPLLLSALLAPLLLIGGRPRTVWDVVVALLPVLLMVLFKYGLTRQPPRLLGPVTVGGVLTYAWVLRRLPWAERGAPWLGLAAVAYYVAGLRGFSLPPLTAQWLAQAALPALVPALLALAALVVGPRRLTGRARAGAMVAATVVLLLAGNTGLRQAETLYDDHRYEQWRPYFDDDMGHGWEWMNRQTAGRPTTIAFAGDMTGSYPLFGTHLTNLVLPMPRGPYPEAAIYGLGRPYHDPDADPWYEAWLANVRTWGVRYVHVSVLYDEQRWPYEGHWAEDHPEAFKLVWESRRTRVYEVR